MDIVVKWFVKMPACGLLASTIQCWLEKTAGVKGRVLAVAADLISQEILFVQASIPHVRIYSFCQAGKAHAASKKGLIKKVMAESRLTAIALQRSALN